jgi:hypothetical protein
LKKRIASANFQTPTAVAISTTAAMDTLRSIRERLLPPVKASTMAGDMRF